MPLERADTQSGGLIRPPFVRARGTPAVHTAMLIALALAGPLLWALFDWITAGSPTYSFTGTRETVETLERQTGPVDLVLYGPRRLGEVLQWPGMVGAAGGVLLAPRSSCAAAAERSFIPYEGSNFQSAWRRWPSPSAPSPSSPAPGWRSSPATRCWPRRSWRSSPPSPCSAGACWSAATPGAAPGRRSPRSSR